MTTTDTRPSTTSKRGGRHPINIGHLVMGIAFLGIVVVWILVETDAVTGDDIRWLLPVPWVLAGMAGLIASTRRHRDTDEWREAAYSDHERGWVGAEPESHDQPHPDHPAYDDLDEKLARAEAETRTRTAVVVAEEPEQVDPVDPEDPDDPEDPVDPEDPDDPADPVDPTDPADPADPTNTKENDQ